MFRCGSGKKYGLTAGCCGEAAGCCGEGVDIKRGHGDVASNRAPRHAISTRRPHGPLAGGKCSYPNAATNEWHSRHLFLGFYFV
jgi:hypothetical protein